VYRKKHAKEVEVPIYPRTKADIQESLISESKARLDAIDLLEKSGAITEDQAIDAYEGVALSLGRKLIRHEGYRRKLIRHEGYRW